MKHYLDENLKYLGKHAKAPSNSVYILPDVLVNKAYKLSGEEIVYDPEGQQILDQQKQIEEQNAAHETKVQERLLVLENSKRLKAEIAIINLSKQWSQETWNSYILEPAVQQIGALLTDGFLQTAREAMASADLSEYYTQEEIDYLIAKVDSYLGE